MNKFVPQRMTRKNNRKFLRRGFWLSNAAGFFLVLIFLSADHGWLSEGSQFYPILVFLVAASGIPAFVYLGLLGIMPHFFRFHYNSIASEKEKKQFEQINFLVLED